MNGIHDLGGMAGFGPVEVEADEPTFHEAWEATAFRINVASIALLRAYNTDAYRHAVERMVPLHYLQARYYERVLPGAASLLVEKGILDLAELEARAGGRFPLALPERPNADDGRAQPKQTRFAVGDRVRVRALRQPGESGLDLLGVSSEAPAGRLGLRGANEGGGGRDREQRSEHGDQAEGDQEDHAPPGGPVRLQAAPGVVPERLALVVPRLRQERGEVCAAREALRA